MEHLKYLIKIDLIKAEPKFTFEQDISRTISNIEMVFGRKVIFKVKL